MDTEILIVVLAAFVRGGTMGASGMLLPQWVVRKMSPPPQRQLNGLDERDVDGMKADVADLSLRLYSMDARLDFTEQLLGGALSGARPPQPLAPPQQAAPPQSAPTRLQADPNAEAASDPTSRLE